MKLMKNPISDQHTPHALHQIVRVNDLMTHS